MREMGQNRICLIRDFVFLATIFSCIHSTEGAKKIACHDCVGEDCVENCDGEYCIMTKYEKAWFPYKKMGAENIKGCLSGDLIQSDLDSSCDVLENGNRITCICKNKNECNDGKTLPKLKKETISLVKCECTGVHCNKKESCFGELCVWSKYLGDNNNKVEKGCINASIPLVKERLIGACTLPSLTGFMHQGIGKTAETLLRTESCYCDKPYCNRERPYPEKAEDDENQDDCEMHLKAAAAGKKMTSKESSCKGEFCYTMSVNATKLGPMTHFATRGCLSFDQEATLTDMFKPTGCARFNGGGAEVELCMRTNSKRAIGRTNAQEKVESVNEDEDESEEESTAEEEKQEEREEEKSSKSSKEEEKSRRESSEKSSKKGKGKKQQEVLYAEEPTQPPIPDDSNSTMVAVFVLIILCILGSGIVWKFELHKKLRRGNYDSVAGG